ncbi:choice-of-anchor Q domain-containing protein [Dyadobacter sp. CY356]|uniref:choice-of-anchor Q domain-containing protein n=1 Tax=Dyadobacter sp. CY356 TaxID=2906442 RepID=UPI001F356387|nr:choice-of-anchor Q domain-containing protein [Dyadobacter sp. CY356]MCF0059149.1 T9SS type A sorting domain-containing protein [Dyadobacter sp. CY356]
MKRKISTHHYLLLLLALLSIQQVQAQQKGESVVTTKKQELENRYRLAKTSFDKIIEKASKIVVDSKSLKLSKTRFANSKLTRSSAIARHQNENGSKTLHDSLAKNWLKRTVIASKKRNRVARPHMSAARKTAITDVPGTLFVDYQASGLNDGTSWENAFVELADALFYAKYNPGVLEIWVANGVYHPLFDHNYQDEGDDYSPHDNVFMMLPGIKIYGGFTGIEESVTQRNLRISSGSVFTGNGGGDFATILSGDILDDDYTTGTLDNTYHVVFSAGDVNGASLDGFVIAGGIANGAESVIVNGETIARNVGAGIAVFNSSPSLSNLLIADNSSAFGSAVYGFQSNFVMTNALIIYNYASKEGPVYIDNSSPIITNATIASNTAAENGGGITFKGANTAATVRNTIVYANDAPVNPDIFFSDADAEASFAYSIIKGSKTGGVWNPGFGTNVAGNLDTDPQFVNLSYGYFALKPNSPAINNGNNEYFQTGESPDLSALTTDQRGTARIIKETVDIGALESLYGILTTNLVPNNAGILFVRQGGSGSMTGESWDNAAAEVADALLAANLRPEILEIWVAGGKYLPLYRPDNLSNEDPKSQYNAFLLVDGVSLYGGFAGTETSRDQRDLSISTNASVLSGDFDGDDDFNFSDIKTNGPGEESENAYRVVNIIGLREYGAALDGFTIEGAHNLYGDINETILVNEAEVPSTFGAGVFVLEADPLIENVIIRNNMGLLGGGLTAVNSGTIISNSIIYHNLDVVAGSGIVHYLSTLPMVMFNTTVAQNLSLTNGPAVGIAGAKIAIANSIIFHNILSDDSPNGGGIPPESNFTALGAVGSIGNSIIGGSGGSINWKLEVANTETYLEDLGGNLDKDPLFQNMDNSDFSLNQCSPAIDAGKEFYYQEGSLPQKDIAGETRIFNGKLDMGALEFQGIRPASATELAGNGESGSFVFEDMEPHTFSVNGEVCGSDLLTLIPEVLSGTVTAKVWVDSQVNSYGGAFYLQRHYDISPADNAESALGRAILYFTQDEFDALNAKLTASAYLPTGNPNGEQARIGNLRIYQFHGPSAGDTGSPSSYGDSRTVIDPDDDDIVWNSGKNRWEVAFNVDGFSGFFGGTLSQNPLPVRLVSFEGKRTSEQETKLYWKVVEQEDIKTYQVEYSASGKNFIKIGQVKANLLASTDYSFTDSLVHAGNQAYYRLKIIELDGKISYSRIVSVKLSAAEAMIAYPVPAKNDLWIDWKKTADSKVQFVDLNGSVLKTVTKTSASQKVDISTLPSGVFLLKTNGSEIIKIVKE